MARRGRKVWTLMNADEYGQALRKLVGLRVQIFGLWRVDKIEIQEIKLLKES